MKKLSLEEVLKGIEDNRSSNSVIYPLHEILFIINWEHSAVYNNMISKREEEIVDLQNKIEKSRQYDEVSRQKCDNLKST